MVQKEYSKATAIEYIQKELHLVDDEIYAFGDSSNDLDMIKAAGHGVIMGHHDPGSGAICRIHYRYSGE